MPPIVQLELLDPKLPIVDQVYRHVRQLVLSLKLKPGEALSEKELSLRLGVSRTPVREALIKLSEDGLVDILPQRGSFVAPIRVAEVLEAQFIREALETAVVRRVATNPVPGLQERLESLLARQLVAIKQKSLDEFLALDATFHGAFCDACNLPRAWKIIQNVKGQLERVCYLDLPDPAHQMDLYDQHCAIVQAIGEGKPDLAVKEAKLHLQEVFKSVELLMNTQPSLFVGTGPSGVVDGQGVDDK